jgi:heme a synthase
MNQKNRKSLNSFRRISGMTTVAIYFLILVGGIVRSTGAGMGCPDWPKCFGRWIPPTSVEQLPEEYEALYLHKRLAKNDRFVVLLENIGFASLANEIRNDQSILENEPFNATKTWIEYINRLIGVIIGFMIILTCIYSLKVRKLDPYIPLLSFGSLLMVLFQGWLGSIVVSTNLLHWMISVHMIVALLLVCLLLYIYFRAENIRRDQNNISLPNVSLLRWVMGTAILLMMVQVLLGTQVREQVDVLASKFNYMNRNLWVAELGAQFLIHRSFSLLLLGLHLYFAFMVWKSKLIEPRIIKLTISLVALIVIVIFSGVVMAYFAIPAFIQPIHLLLGSLIIGFQYYIWLELGTYNKTKKTLHYNEYH